MSNTTSLTAVVVLYTNEVIQFTINWICIQYNLVIVLAVPDHNDSRWEEVEGMGEQVANTFGMDQTDCNHIL